MIENQEIKKNIKDQIYYWLNKRKGFIINGEYKIDLLWIDHKFQSAKILITNLKNGDSNEVNFNE